MTMRSRSWRFVRCHLRKAAPRPLAGFQPPTGLIRPLPPRRVLGHGPLAALPSQPSGNPEESALRRPTQKARARASGDRREAARKGTRAGTSRGARALPGSSARAATGSLDTFVPRLAGKRILVHADL